MTTFFQSANQEIDIDALLRASKRLQSGLKPGKKPLSGQSETVLMERSLMLAPLGLLAACGGSGAASTPAPTPGPAPSPTFPLVADSLTATALASPTSVNVLANEVAPGSTATITTVTAAGGTAVTATATGAEVSTTLGTLTIKTDGNFTFNTEKTTGGVASLSHGLTTTETFTVNATSGTQTGTEQLTVTVNGANHAPSNVSATINILPTATLAPLNIQAVTDSDVTTVGGTTPADILKIGNVTAPQHGTLVDANGVAVDLTTIDPKTGLGGVFYKPTGTTAVADSFTFHVTDGAGGDTTETITIGINSGVDLNALTSAQGVKFTGVTGAAQLGFSVAGGADVTGDGKVDLVIGAPGQNGGTVYIVSGTGSALAADLTGAGVQALVGKTGTDRFGTSVALGDVGSTATADLIIGAPGTSGAGGGLNDGSAYIVYGGSSISLPSANNSVPGFIINGTEQGLQLTGTTTTTSVGSNLGYAVFALGDINGDGKADYFIGVPGQDYVPNGQPGSPGDNGFALIGYGGAGKTGTTALFDFGSTIGFEASGNNDAKSLFGLSAVSGDWNGDGKTDLIFASPHDNVAIGQARPDAGRVSVFFGPLPNSGNAPGAPGTTLDNASASLKLYGAAGDLLGTSMAVGDVNGDGIQDLIIGAPGHNTVYVVLGAASNTLAGGGIDLAGIGNSAASAANFVDAAGVATSGSGHAMVGGVDVIRIVGQSGSGFGSSVAYLPNFNGDTNGDFAVGTDGTTGYAYVIAGRGQAAFDKGVFPTTPDSNSVTLLKTTPGSAGAPNVHVTVANVSDLNGDGLSDIAIGAVGYGATGGVTGGTTGSAYVLYGNKVGFITPASVSVSAQTSQAVVAHTSAATVDHVIQHYAPVATAAAAPTVHVNAVAADVLAVHAHVMFDPHMHVNAV